MTSLLGGIGTKGRVVARPDRDGAAGRGLGARLFPYALVAPTLLLLAVFTLFPLVQGFWTSFFKRGLVVAPRAPSTHPVFVGLDNYLALASDPEFTGTLVKTVGFVCVAVPLVIVVSLALALLLARPFRGVGAIRAVVFFPYMTSLLIVGIVWKWLLGYNSGLINFMLDLAGMAPVPWLENELLAQAALVFVWVWANAGFYMMIFIAGLMMIPGDYYEAAAIDAASPWRAFRRITLPLLRPTMLIALVLASVEAFKVYEVVVSLTHGGPGRATVYLIQAIYETGFTKPASAGFAAAQSMALFAILMALTVLQLRMAKER
jgi:alpha-1,4-digalacturonate transport system permease protein